MTDLHFEHPRLIAIYDALDPDRRDLEPYAALVHQVGARRVLDLGCGTGVFALLLADRRLDVIGVDPAAGSLDVARAKPGADRVRWIHGDATTVPSLQVDVVTMTGNVAQAIADPPPGTPRCRLRSPRCAPAAAWFSRPATWIAGPGRTGTGRRRTGSAISRTPVPSRPGSR